MTRTLISQQPCAESKEFQVSSQEPLALHLGSTTLVTGAESQQNPGKCLLFPRQMEARAGAVGCCLSLEASLAFTNRSDLETCWDPEIALGQVEHPFSMTAQHTPHLLYLFLNSL